MASSNSNNMSSGKREAATLSEEERTPKRLKMEPDVVVVVGGVEFYHYQYVLCDASEVIDTMLANDMKESKEKRIEFKDKDPNLWLTVYKCMDPTTKEEEFECVFRDSCVGNSTGLLKPNTLAELLSWFDFLGMQTMIKKVDKLAAHQVVRDNEENKKYHAYTSWSLLKHLPCPHTQRAIEGVVKHTLVLTAYYLSRQATWTITMEHLGGYFLDDQCGDDMWSHLLSKVDFPDRLLQEDREVIVSSPIFPAVLELAGRSMTEKPAKFSFCLEEEDEKENEEN